VEVMQNMIGMLATIPANIVPNNSK